MPTYSIATITASQAANFGINDQLTFTGSISTAGFLGVRYNIDPSAGANLSITSGLSWISFGPGIYGHSFSFSDGSVIYIGNPNLADRFTGTAAREVIFGGGMYGLFPRNGGQDSIDGGAGDDVIYLGGSGTAVGGDGNDWIYGGDSIGGGAGNDYLSVYPNTKYVSGGDGGDTIGSWEYNAGQAIYIDAGSGNDYLSDVSSPGNDTIVGGTGIDTLYYDLQGISIKVDLSLSVPQQIGAITGLDIVSGFENVDCWSGSATIAGNSSNNLISCDTYDDQLYGADGNDTLQGGKGNDTIFGGAGDDFIIAGRNDVLVELGREPIGTYLRGDDGNDSIEGEVGFDDINGNKGNDTAAGGYDSDWVVGGQANDLLYGGFGNVGDTADTGNDIVYGNLGNDTCYGGAGGDTIRGGQGDDVVFGENGNDWLSGDRGNDTLTGGAGADIFHSFSGAGIDRVLDFNLAQGDRVQLDPGTSYTVSQVGADTVINMGNGDQMILVGVTATSLTGSWIFIA